jgi:hypothetical protein
MTPAKKKATTPRRSVHDRDVAGYCPACGNPTVQVSTGGRLVCVQMDCPWPEAPAVLLDRAGETAHLVQLDPDAFSIQHPLIERLDGTLFGCALHTYLEGQDHPLGPVGRYRVVAGGNDWIFSRMEDEA